MFTLTLVIATPYELGFSYLPFITRECPIVPRVGEFFYLTDAEELMFASMLVDSTIYDAGFGYDDICDCRVVGRIGYSVPVNGVLNIFVELTKPSQ